MDLPDLFDLFNSSNEDSLVCFIFSSELVFSTQAASNMGTCQVYLNVMAAATGAQYFTFDVQENRETYLQISYRCW